MIDNSRRRHVAAPRLAAPRLAAPRLAALVIMLLAHAEAGAAGFFRAITVRSELAVEVANFQVPVEFSNISFDFDNAGEAGVDVRFARRLTPGKCPPGAFDLPYWIEVWQSGGSDFTRVWVTIPTIPAGGETTVYMFYGDPARTVDRSSFSAVFSNPFVSDGNAVLDGDQNFDWFEVKAGDVITLRSERPLTINARHVIIRGRIDGSSAGFRGGTTLDRVGRGPGGGGESLNGGGGGGGYGGNGGDGGGSFSETPGAGGMVYGAAGAEDIQPGSGGGASQGTAGGAGGGAVTLRARRIFLTNTSAIVVDGQAGGSQGIGGSNGGGGGSGGGILLVGSQIVVRGTLSASGGNSSLGPQSAGTDDGGGGGGGRIKLSYGRSLSTTGATIDLSGGDTQGQGSARGGGLGSLALTEIDLPDVSARLGGEEACVIENGLFRNSFEAVGVTAGAGAGNG